MEFFFLAFKFNDKFIPVSEREREWVREKDEMRGNEISSMYWLYLVVVILEKERKKLI